MRFFFLSWWVTQVYNKTVIALYLDFIHSYLFCFYFDEANALDLSMYSNVYEDCNMNPGRDKC